MHPQRPAGGCDVLTRAPLMVADIATPEHALRVHVLEFGEDAGGGHADHVSHHVEPPPVAHGQQRQFRPIAGGGIQEGVQQGDEGSSPFQRVALGSYETGVEEPLEQFRLSQSFHNPATVRHKVVLLHMLRHPAAAIRVVDVLELDADGAAIDGSPPLRAWSAELLQIGMNDWLQPSQRVQIRLQIPPSSKPIG